MHHKQVSENQSYIQRAREKAVNKHLHSSKENVWASYMLGDAGDAKVNK